MKGALYIGRCLESRVSTPRPVECRVSTSDRATLDRQSQAVLGCTGSLRRSTVSQCEAQHASALHHSWTAQLTDDPARLLQDNSKLLPLLPAYIESLGSTRRHHDSSIDLPSLRSRPRPGRRLPPLPSTASGYAVSDVSSWTTVPLNTSLRLSAQPSSTFTAATCSSPAAQGLPTLSISTTQLQPLIGYGAAADREHGLSLPSAQEPQRVCLHRAAQLAVRPCSSRHRHVLHASAHRQLRHESAHRRVELRRHAQRPRLLSLQRLACADVSDVSSAAHHSR